jgi:hypothetical protein
MRVDCASPAPVVPARIAQRQAGEIVGVLRRDPRREERQRQDDDDDDERTERDAVLAEPHPKVPPWRHGAGFGNAGGLGGAGRIGDACRLAGVHAAWPRDSRGSSTA